MGIQTTILRPVDATAGGHWRGAARVAGLTGTAANAPLFAFRWTNQQMALQIHRLSVDFGTTTAFTTLQAVDFAAIKASAFSAMDTGGNALTFTPKGVNQQGQGIVAGTDFDCRYGALVAGTRTLAPDPFAIEGAPSNLSAQLSPWLFDVEHEGNLVLNPMVAAGKAEGFVVTLLTALGAAGIISVWFELAFSVVQPGNVVL